MRVTFLDVGEEEFLGHLGKLPMVHHVLHGALALAVEGVENTVVNAVELQGWHIEQFTQLLVECGRGLDPTAIQIQFGVAMHGKYVTSEQLDQTGRREVVTHVGQADARRDPAVPCARRQQCCLGHAITLAGRQCKAAAEGLRVATEGIGVIAHRLAHSVVKTDCLVTKCGTRTAMFFGELHHRRVVTIDEAAGIQVRIHEVDLRGKP